MARMNRGRRYYNYPNLSTNMNHTQNQRVVTEEPMLHAMNEQGGMTTPTMGEQNTYENETSYENQSTSETESEEEEVCKVRFFNAAAGYGGLSIDVGDKRVSENLMFGLVTDFVNIPNGFQPVTIKMIQEPEAVILNKRLPFRNCMNTTAAIINTSTGVEVMMINDMGCQLEEEDRACFRVANLSYTSPPLDVVLENGNPVFEDVRFKYVTEYKQAVPGEYNFNVMIGRTPELLKNNTIDLIAPEQPTEEGGYPMEDEKAYTYFFQDFEEGDRYTAYIIGNKGYEPSLRVETLEEKD